MPPQFLDVIEQLKKIDRANYTCLVREREIKKRKGITTLIPDINKIIAIYLGSQKIADSLINAYSNQLDKLLAYTAIQTN